MSLWDFKALFYKGLRSFLPFQWILAQEIRGLTGLLDHLKVRSETVLDLGTGTGPFLNIFPDDTPIIGVDRSVAMLRRVPRKDVFCGVAADASTLPFRNNTFTLVAVVGLSEYLYDKTGLLREIKRVAATGGHLLITTARPGLPNMLRNLLGHRIHTVSSDLWEILTRAEGFECMGQTKTWLQKQYLYRASEN
jgi:ubiquinone/menaquinone biosynthesis C-methylase UbiE